jgi:transcriptional regulator with XRE-family HTH domain
MARSRRISVATGNDIRLARQGAGLSLRATAAGVGMDYSVFGRLERGLLPNVTVAQLSLACSAVGLEFTGRAYPDGEPMRDAGHLRLLERLRSQLPIGAPWRTEVPLPIPGDRRAVDAETRFDDRRIGFEVETRLGDVQALERRVSLKKRDAHLDVLVLVIGDTRGNRLVLREQRVALRTTFPLGTRGVLAALRDGTSPANDGILVI